MYENIIQKHLKYIQDNKDKQLEFEVRFEIEYSVYDILKKINSLQKYSVKKENSIVEYHGKYERKIIYSDKVIEEKKVENLSNVDKLQIQGFTIKIAVSEEIETKIILSENPIKRKRERYIIENFFINGAHLHLTRAEQGDKVQNSIEIEYDVDIISTADDVLKPIKYIFDIMYVKSYELLTTEQSKEIIKQFNKHIIEFKENRKLQINNKDKENLRKFKIINFEDKPVSFEEKHIPLVKTKDYYVTNKLNGVRYFLYILNGEFYLIGKSSKKDIIEIDLVWLFTKTNSNIKGVYILDGEYFNNNYYAFDILYHDNEIIVDKQYIYRLDYLVKLTNYMYSFISNIFMKYIKYGIDTYDVIQYMKLNFTEWDYDNDGLIYTSFNSLYADKENKTLKWKFDHHQSLDVSIKSIVNKPNYYECYVVNVDNTHIEINEIIKDKNKYKLYSSTKFKDNDIVEISFDRTKKEFFPIRLRPDKINPNFITVAKSFWKDIKNPIPITTLSKKNLILNSNCTWKSYRSYANKTAKTNIINSLDKEHIIIDIGFGKGADIEKYIYNGNKYIIGIEPDENNIKEFIKRSKDKLKKNNNIYTYTTSGKKIDLSIINKSGSDETLVEDIKRLLDQYQYKNEITVCMFFSLTYFFNKDDDFVKLVDNIYKFYSKRIVGTVMDGIKTIDFINNYSYDENCLKLSFNLEGENITNEKELQKLGGFTNDIYISIPDSSTVKGHHEYLVFFNNFESILRWYGYYLYDKEYFNFKSPNENCLLNYFSSLNLKFDFRINKNYEQDNKLINYMFDLNKKIGIPLYSNYFYKCINNIRKNYKLSYEDLYNIIEEMFLQNKNHIVKYDTDYFLIDENDDVIENEDELDFNNKVHHVLTNSINKNFVLTFEIEINDILINKLFVSLKKYKINNILYDYYMKNENEVKEFINYLKQYKSELRKNNIIEYNSNIGTYTIHFTELFNKVLVYEPNSLNYELTRHNVSLFYNAVNYELILKDNINVLFKNSNIEKIDENDVLFLNLKFINNPYDFINEIINTKNEIIILTTNYLKETEKYFKNFIVHKLVNSYVYFINFQITILELTPQYISSYEKEFIQEYIDENINEFTLKSPDYPQPDYIELDLDNLEGVIKLDTEKIEHLFNNMNNKRELIDLTKLKFTEESLYSITPFEEAHRITDRIVKHLNKNDIIITDATANVGGNTISFYNDRTNDIKKVNSVEIDELTCKILKNNLVVYGYPIGNVYCEDYLNIYLKLEQDCVFFDPPWGGKDYKKYKSLDLFLGEKNIVDIIIELFEKNKVKYVVLKAPINFNETKLLNTLNLDRKIPIPRYKENYGTHISYYVYFITGLK